MSEPTKAQLQKELTEARAAKERALGTLKDIDPEARAFSACVAALGHLTTKSRDFRSDPRTNTDAIRRVIEALRARFNLDALDEPTDFGYFSPEIESQDDPRDAVIAQLIDALRKS